MKRFSLALAAACVSCALHLNAQELHLKTRIIDTKVEQKSGLMMRAAGANPRSMSGRRWHWLIQFESEKPDFTVWKMRGAQVLSAVPVNGYVISTPEEMEWDGLEYIYRAPILASDKISPLVSAAAIEADGTTPNDDRQLVIVRFHKDVQAWEGDAILEAEQLVSLRNASLEGEDRLLEMTPGQMTALTLWDEVEYVFPAPAAMKEGESFLVCGGVLSGEYEMAMLAASYGEGWDGAGRGRASISYSFGGLGTRTDPEQTKVEVRKALAEWSKAVAVTFTEGTNRQAYRNIDIVFATGSHGDPFPFATGTTVLAHSFYPANPNPEPIAGDIHVNDAWTWSIGGQWDVYSVILHELGHSLGIGHTDTPGTVMYPYYQKATVLKQEDIDSMLKLYAAPDSPTTPTTPTLSLTITSPNAGTTTSAATANFSGAIVGGGAGLRVTYRNVGTGQTASCLVNSVYTIYTCASIPLASGANRVRVEGTLGSASASVEREIVREANGDVAMSITSPAASSSTTTGTEIRVNGTASHSGGIASVTWSTNRGRSGTATGLESWSAQVALETGSNTITITAVSRTGIRSTRNISVERTAGTTPALPSDPGGDKTPPRMTIQQPIGNFIITSASKLTFRGTATDNVGVTQVTWTNSAGDQSGAARATTNSGAVNWSFDVNIAVGFNAIQVRAWDVSGNSTLYSTTVRRY